MKFKTVAKTAKQEKVFFPKVHQNGAKGFELRPC